MWEIRANSLRASVKSRINRADRKLRPPASTAEIATAAQTVEKITSPTPTLASRSVPSCHNIVAAVMTTVRLTATTTRPNEWRNASPRVVI